MREIARQQTAHTNSTYFCIYYDIIILSPVPFHSVARQNSACITFVGPWRHLRTILLKRLSPVVPVNNVLFNITSRHYLPTKPSIGILVEHRPHSRLASQRGQWKSVISRDCGTPLSRTRGVPIHNTSAIQPSNNILVNVNSVSSMSNSSEVWQVYWWFYLIL